MARRNLMLGRRHGGAADASTVRGLATLAAVLAVVTFFISRLFRPLAARRAVSSPAAPASRPMPRSRFEPRGAARTISAEAETIVPPAGHEAADVGRSFIGSAFALLIASLAVVTLCVLWLFPLPSTDRTLRTPLPVYPRPRLQPNPRQEMQRFLAEERTQLTSYGWVDKSHGIVHLPVDVAMKEIAERGLADWPTPAGQSAKNFTPSATPSTAMDAPQ